MRMPVSDITVGERAREVDDAKLRGLSDSIRELGQLQPIVVDSEYNLIGGARRLRCCELLGIEVEVFVAKNIDDAVKRLKAERDENLHRLPDTLSELAELGKRIEAIEKPAADARKKAGINQHTEPERKFPQGSTGKTSDKVASALGMSGKTYEKAKAVVAAAAKPDAPEEIKQAAAEMDRTGKVDPAFKAVKEVQSRWEQGASQLPAVSDHSDADSESDGLFALKQAWKRATKKDRKTFLAWTKESQ